MKNLKLPYFLLFACAATTSSGNPSPDFELGAEKVYELEDYIVTGSNIPGHLLEIEIPFERLSEEDLDLWGHVTARDALLEQPFSYGYANSDTQSNGVTGSAGANLRGLGNLDTLTLINGRRAGGNSAVGFEHGGFADLNLIPLAAIQEVQIAVDGTSVIYGSDAVAGTVNFLLHDDFIGGRIDGSYSNTTQDDAAEQLVSFLFGEMLGEKTHLVLSGSWFERNAIFARDRAISQTTDFTSQGGINQGSGTVPGRIQVDGVQYALDGVDIPTDLNDYTTTLTPFNFNEFAPAIPELEQRSIMANMSHQISDHLEIWTELLFTETEFANALAPAPWSSGFFPSLLSAAQASPHLPDLQGGTLESFSYRNFELGNLEPFSDKQAHRALIGLKGEVDRWSWEGAAMIIESDLERTYTGIADEERLITSITNGSFNPFATAFSSGSTNGVAFDNEAAIQAAATTAHESFEEEFRSIDFKVGGPLLELPAGDLQVLIGAEYRTENIKVQIDPDFAFPGIPGAWSIYNPYEAERTVYSLFGESIVPILGGVSDPGGPSLNAQFAIRYDDYSDKSGNLENTYDSLVHKAGFVFSPTSELTLNASFSTAFRAPTHNESFNTSFSSLVYNTGTAENPSFARFTTQLSANPDLAPEESDILNFVLTYEPEYLDGFTAQINYYRIETKDAINHNGQELVDNGATGFVVATRFNTSEVITDGFEYEINYAKRFGDHDFQATLGLNQILSYRVRPADGEPEIDFMGRLVHPLVPSESIQGPGSIPEFKGFAQLVWSFRNMTIGGTLNYIHSLEDNATTTFNGQPREIKSWTSLDLVARYAWPEDSNRWLSGTTVTLGIDNVTNKQPPFAAGAFADGYDSSLYSLEGRRFTLSLSKEF